jgi:hypothetical protein
VIAAPDLPCGVLETGRRCGMTRRRAAERLVWAVETLAVEPATGRNADHVVAGKGSGS